MKLTRHNGRSGKNGAYNPKHNDRRFDIENSGHIDTARTADNVYWDWINGYTASSSRENSAVLSFEAVEKEYYSEHYGDHVEAQNRRNEASRHTERNRTVSDLLKNKHTCPEETIYQIGTVEDHAPPEVLLAIVTEFMEQFRERFGANVHILDWSLHLDEGTPHIHERHVFDCKNRYGELCPQQEKALEELGVPIPEPDKPKSKRNNRKMVFDAACRRMLFDITKKHGLELDEEPEFGGREYMEKQDFILAKQAEKIARQNETAAKNTETIALQEAVIGKSAAVISERKKVMEEQAMAIARQEEAVTKNAGVIAIQQSAIREAEDAISEKEKRLKEQDAALAGKKRELAEEQVRLDRVKMKISDMESLVGEVADAAYEKACEVVADTVRTQTQEADLREIEKYKDWVTAPERRLADERKELIARHLAALRDAMMKRARQYGSKMRAALHRPETEQAGKEQIREAAKESLQEKLRRAQAEAESLDRMKAERVLPQDQKKKTNIEI